MQDYSERLRGSTQGENADVAKCAIQDKTTKNGSNKSPSVLAVSPTLCALQLYRITLFTWSTGGTALCPCRHKNAPIRQPHAGCWVQGAGGCLSPSLQVKIEQCCLHEIQDRGRGEESSYGTVVSTKSAHLAPAIEAQAPL